MLSAQAHREVEIDTLVQLVGQGIDIDPYLANLQGFQVIDVNDLADGDFDIPL